MEGMQLNLVAGNQSVERKRNLKSDDEPNVKVKKRKVGGGEEHSGEGDGGGGGGRSADYISSLFKSNPDIPKLAFANVEPVQEAVFTSKTFKDAGIHPYLVQNMSSMSMDNMTLVQSKAIPVIMAGKDALVKSQTGSGKTLAYAVPILHKLQEVRPKIERSDGVYALIIVPTRELAVQSFECFQKLCRSYAWIVPGVLLGGEKKKSEKARIRKGINVLISTPGRLIDHIDRTKCLSLGKLRWLVLDEADRMLELGYERDVQSVVTAINEQQVESSRQTLLLSATLTTGIEQLSEVSMKHPTFVDAAEAVEDERCLTTPDLLKQNFVIVPAKLRLVVLAAFLLWKCRFSRSRKVLVFLSTQDMVDYHCELFDRCLNASTCDDDEGEEEELTADAKDLLEKRVVSMKKRPPKARSSKKIEFLKLHGSMNQKDRLDVFTRYRSSTSGGILFCTDVAARGLDMAHVDWIVQYNPPTCEADYVHRVGRTARIGTRGSSLLFVLPSEANFVLELEKQKLVLAELTVDRVLEKLFENPEPSQKTGRLPRSMEESATNLQMKLENAVAGDKGLHERASQAYVSFVRSYASFPKEIRHVFCFKSLHLGHIAKSFALRDPPNRITGIGKGRWVKNDETKRHNNIKREEAVIKAQKKRINQKRLIVSEFDSGFNHGKNKQKQKARKPKKAIK